MFARACAIMFFFKAIVILFVLVLILPSHSAKSQTSYYVGGAGALDTNPGTASQPFATIQKAATVAASGSTINIRAGTYRETVTPANSGLTFQPDGTASVTISGLNTADGGWSVHSGNIYKKTIALPNNAVSNSHYNTTISNNATLAANQVFKDGVMMIEARWPNISTPDQLFIRDDVWRKRNQTLTWYNNNLTDTGMPAIDWTGGKICAAGWFIAQSKTITSDVGNTINYDPMTSDLRFLQYFYLTGKLGALDIAKEWHYENGILYFWQSGGGSPTGVEYKVRNYGFDLRDKSNISIIGIKFLGCEIDGNTNTNNITLDNIRAEYFNHVVTNEGPDVIYYNAHQTGFKLYGSNNVVKNSEFKYAASAGVTLGQNGQLQNNLMKYINYEANYGAPFEPYGSTGGQKILNNTMAWTGRAAIDFGSVTDGQHLDMEIGYNNIYNWNALSYDGGAIYGARFIKTTGLVIHHNWIHDSKSQTTPHGYSHSGTTDHLVGICAGIYFDQSLGPGTIHHNILWNNYQTDLHISHVNSGRDAGKSWVYNNTFATESDHVDGINTHHSYLTIDLNSANYDVFRNNIFVDDVSYDYNPQVNGQRDISNCIVDGTNPLFSGGGIPLHPAAITNPESYFLLQSGSPARNVGVLVSGINNGDTGGYDAGAYYFGATPWVPGYNAVTVPPTSGPTVTTLNNTQTGTALNQFEYVGAGWASGSSAGAYLNDEHYSATTNAFYQLDFTGSQIDVYAQKFNSQGIAAYSIDGGAETAIDHYNPTLILNTLVYTSPTLTNGPHTLKVRVTGTKNPSCYHNATTGRSDTDI